MNTHYFPCWYALARRHTSGRCYVIGYKNARSEPVFEEQIRTGHS